MKDSKEKTDWELDDLPTEVKLEILQYLGVTTLVNARMVSKGWEKLLNDHLIWQRLISNHFPNYHETLLPNQNFSELYKKIELNSYQIIKKTHSFYKDKIPFKPYEITLFRAAKNNDIVTFEKILNKHYSKFDKLISLFKLSDINNYSVFNWIGKLSNKEIANLLFSKIYSLWKKINSDYFLENTLTKECSISIIHIAAALNQVSFLKEINKKLNGLLNHYLKTKKPEIHPLVVACEFNSYDAALFFIQNDFKINDILNNSRGNCIHSASKCGSAKLINYLLTQGHDLDINLIDEHSMTPLMHAIRYENLDAVEALIKAGADVNVVPKEELLPNCIVLAYNTKNEAIIDLLLNEDIDLTALSQLFPHSLYKNQENKPYPNQQILNKLFSYILKKYFTEGSVLDYKKRDSIKNTIIHWHAFCNIKESLEQYPKTLLDQQNNFIETPLDLATFQNNVEVTKTLNHVGAINDIPGYYGMTPFFYAVDNGYLELVNYYLSLDSTNINTQDGYKSTPLIKACEKGHLAVVKQLLCHPKIDINAQNSGDVTPLIAAARAGHLEIIAELLIQPEINIIMKTKNNQTALSLDYVWIDKEKYRKCTNLIVLLRDCSTDDYDIKHGFENINQDWILTFLIQKKQKLRFTSSKFTIFNIIRPFMLMKPQNERSKADNIFDSMLDKLKERQYKLVDIETIIHSAFSELIKNEFFDHNLKAIGSCLKLLKHYIKNNPVNELLTCQNNNMTGI